MLAWFASIALTLPVAQQLTWENYPQVRAAVMPAAADERWLDIPWRTAFWDAVVEARAEPRPILLWTMNGHPLGCV